MSDAVAALERALAGLVDAVAGVAPGWLVLGVALHLANQVARGRGGDAVRVLLLARRMPGKGNRALLTGTIVAETAGESALGAAMLALALAVGVGPTLGPSSSTVLYVLAGVLAIAAAVLLGRRHPRVRGFLTR